MKRNARQYGGGQKGRHKQHDKGKRYGPRTSTRCSSFSLFEEFDMLRPTAKVL